MGTFNSAQNGNWNTDATWAEAGHPTANDDVVIIILVEFLYFR